MEQIVTQVQLYLLNLRPYYKDLRIMPFFKKNIFTLFILVMCTYCASGQYKVALTRNASIGTSPNVETYFFVEKLAVEHIGNYVFDIKGVDYSHQPMVHFGFANFKLYQNDPIILRAADILKKIRDTLADNGPILNHLLNQKDFPAKGSRFAEDRSKVQTSETGNKLMPLFNELTDSLRKFYIKANVAGFLKDNSAFYKGALREIAKDIDGSVYSAIEKWYGNKFPNYELYISPAMPITPGEGNYRGFGPTIFSPKGKIPSMVVSSSVMLGLQDNLSAYKKYGFDSPEVTQFLTVHEVSHAFVNPLLEKYKGQIMADSALFVKGLKDTLSTKGIRNWYVCVIEHLVRLGEIRIAVSVGNQKEADRLRVLHIGEYNCVLLPLLEEKITEYEKNRANYPTFERYVPELVQFMHSLTPEIVNNQLLKYGNYKTGS
ncbi:DUF4932 domain-containing protein [Pedobacter psychrodurus]|uniref:DUF4932 domain-containing protein n=1 Tax=Pedobacter psychrodurus TaxID=2530456 RepID=UPI00292D4E51|nr:DUF4932 domain-containing protein [Pedobacter psychrodurus]